jgi:fructose 1,6-bisphosphatase
MGVEFKSQRYFVKRIFLYFDTSPIPANALVKSANLNMYAGQFVNAHNTIHVIRSIAGVPLSNDDFAKVQLVSGGSATPQHNSWMNINLNPVALDWIVKGGMTELALVHESDLNNSIHRGGCSVCGLPLPSIG